MHVTITYIQEIKINYCGIKKKTDYKEKQMNSAILYMNKTTTRK